MILMITEIDNVKNCCFNKIVVNHFNHFKKIASGGELSRIMLAIKAVSQKFKKMAVQIIFDEADTGVSGKSCWKALGTLWKKNLKKNNKLFVITTFSSSRNVLLITICLLKKSKWITQVKYM